MIVKWLQNTELEITTHYDEENDEPITLNETFLMGETCDFDIFDTRKDGLVNIQFPNGDVCYGVNPEWYRVEVM